MTSTHVDTLPSGKIAPFNAADLFDFDPEVLDAFFADVPEEDAEVEVEVHSAGIPNWAIYAMFVLMVVLPAVLA